MNSTSVLTFIQGSGVVGGVYVERLHPKGVSFSCWKYIKGSGFHKLTYVCGKGRGKLSNSVFKRAFQNTSNRPSEKMFLW